MRAALLVLVASLSTVPILSRPPTSPSTRPLRQSADIILYGGKVFTADPDNPWAEAVAITGDKITAVGSNAAVRSQAGPATRMFDVGGRVIIPGINDAHDHLGWKAPAGWTLRTNEPWLPGPSSRQLLDSLAVLVHRAPKGAWLEGEFGLLVRNDPRLRREALDRIAPDHPVVLMSSWGHGMILNTPALRALGISEAEPDPMGGWYERDPDTGILTGMVEEYAQWRAWNALYSSAPDSVITDLHRYAAQALRWGITSVQDMSSVLDGDTAERFFRSAQLPLRVRIVPMPGTGPDGRRLANWRNIDRHPAPLTRVSGMKYMLDGTPLEQNALMREPYPGRPDWHGRLLLPPDTIRQILREALSGEEQLMLHMVGDSVTNVLLPLMAELAPDSVWRSRRVRIEHGDGLVYPSQWKRIRDLGIVVVYNPAHAMEPGGSATQPDRVDAPLRSLLEAGIPLAVGSDGERNPFLNIMFATIHLANPEEALTREQAVLAYTRGSAYAEMMEQEKGTLAPGMLADLAVLSQDIFTVPLEALPGTTSVLTLVGGNMAYDAGVLKSTQQAAH